MLFLSESSYASLSPNNSYKHFLQNLILQNNKVLNTFFLFAYLIEAVMVGIVYINFPPTKTLLILIIIEASILILSAIFFILYRGKSRISRFLQYYNDCVIAFLVFAYFVLKSEMFLSLDSTRFVTLTGGMTILPTILLCDKCLIRLRSKLTVLMACFLYTAIRMIASGEAEYVVSLQVVVVFLTSLYSIKSREQITQALFTKIFTSLRKESTYQGILKDFSEPLYLLNSDSKIVFSNMSSMENTKSCHEDNDKIFITNLESGRVGDRNTDTFKFIQELELGGDFDLAYQFLAPLANLMGEEDSIGELLEIHSGRKSSKLVPQSSPKGFRLSIKNESGSLGYIPNFKSPSDSLKSWLKGQSLVQFLELICKNTKRFHDLYGRSSIILSGRVIEEATCLLSPIRSTRDKAIGQKCVEVKLSVTTFHQEQVVMVVVSEKMQVIAPPVSSMQSINEYKINLLASFSHELRTPLNGNLNFLEAAIQRPDLPEDIKTDYLSPALTSATLLFYIVSDILDYSQFSLNKIFLRIKNIKIGNLLGEVVDLFKVQAEKKNLKIHLDFPPDAEIATDQTRLTQILVNLVSNALKFTEEGGLEISATKSLEPSNCYKIAVRDTGIGLTPKQKRKIERVLKGEEAEKVGSKSVGSSLGLTTSGRLAVLLGPAKGTGIMLEPVKKGTKLVFMVENKQLIQNQKSLLDISLSGLIGNSSPQMMAESFHSEGDGNKMFDFKHSGVIHPGLKKSVSSHNILQAEYQKKISTDSQGWIYTTPEEGAAAVVSKAGLSSGMVKVKGSHVTMPSMHTTRKSVMKLASNKDDKCKCNTILIVDDDSFNVMAAEKLFSGVNLTCISVFHGKQAIDTVESRRKCSENCQLFKFILMDCNMPVMDGYEATRYLKKKMKAGELPYIPIVGCTAFVTYFDATRCFDSGMDDYVTKPLGKEKTTRILEKWVRNRPRIQGVPSNAA